jgi:hypothetical protein
VRVIGKVENYNKIPWVSFKGALVFVQNDLSNNKHIPPFPHSTHISINKLF